MKSAKIIRIVSLLLFAPLSFPSFAEDCMVSTDARSFMSTRPELQSEKLVDGNYSALLNGGDIVLARFSTCGLGMSAHYFSVKTLAAEQRMALINMFLKQVLPSDAVINKVIPQLERLQGNRFDQEVVLDGLNDQHRIIVKPSASPLYELHIQYDWIPPEF